MLLSFIDTDQSENHILGLQTLIAADIVGGRNVATRTIAASRRTVGLGGERDPEHFAVEDDGEGEGEEEEEEEEEEGGCWVMYGWRRCLRRLPLLIPSLRRKGSSPWALTRTRTSDGRLVITREPAPQQGRIVARRLGGRLILDLVDGSPVSTPPRQRLPPLHPSITDGADDDDDEEEEEAVSGDIMVAPGLDVPAAVLAAVPILASSLSPVGSAAASPVPAVACFEARDPYVPAAEDAVECA